MSKKIIVVSMVKNEADIIESFIRHSLTFADNILIADHCSGDKTPEILELLCQEGLPIYVEKYHRVELAHAEVMNNLLQRAIKIHGADLILPIDGDEFLVNTETSTSCRKILESLRTDCLYQLNWRTYEPLYPHENESKFLLSRPCRRSHDFVANQKQIVGKEIALQDGFMLGQGCHYAYWKQSKEIIPRTIISHVHIAHFHWRSDEQYAAKVATSWINNIAKYSENTITAGYLKSCYEQLANGEHISPGTTIDNPENFDMRPYCQEIPLRYSENVRPIPMHNLMKASVLIAEAYLEEKILKRKKKITIILPYAGNDKDLQRRLIMVQRQSYPFKEVYIFCLTQINNITNIPRDLVDCTEILEFNKIPTSMKKATGEYVIFIMPGESLSEDTITKLVACIESQDQHYTFISYTERWQSSSLSPYFDGFAVKEFKGITGISFRNMLLEYGKYPAVEISGILIRKELAEACKWFRECFIGGKPLLYLIWICLLQEATQEGAVIGLLPSRSKNLIKSKKLTAEDMIWHQIEWHTLLQEYRDKIPPSTYEAAQRNFNQNKKTANTLQKIVSPSLWQEYEKLNSYNEYTGAHIPHCPANGNRHSG